MNLFETPIAGLFFTETSTFKDERGTFSRLFCDQDLCATLCNHPIKQINHSLSQSIGTIRGIHYQRAPNAEIKMIRCIKGRVWDVAVDLREKSQTFLQWYALELTPENKKMLVIPEGCAHGVQILEESSELLYLHTAAYSPKHEGGIRYDDPIIDISWPLPAADVSIRDQQFPFITDDFEGLKL